MKTENVRLESLKISEVIIFTLEEIKKSRDEIAKFETCLIYSRQHRLFWRSGSNGYTNYVNEAGIYTVNDAIDATIHCGPERGIEYWFIQTQRR